MDPQSLAEKLQIRVSSLEEFEVRVFNLSSDGCWMWDGSTDPDGYGLVTLRSESRRWKTFRAHRLVLALKLARPLEMWALHTCDNPSCVNPEHLYEGTQKDNERDKLERGRHALARRTHCKNDHEFAKHSRPRADGRGRTCKICVREEYERRRKR